MLLILVCIALALSTVGLGLYAYAMTQKMARVIAAHNRLIAALAGTLEVYVVNDTAPDALGKKVAFDHIMLATGEVSAYWKQFPPEVTTLWKSIRDWMERQVIIVRQIHIKK